MSSQSPGSLSVTVLLWGCEESTLGDSSGIDCWLGRNRCTRCWSGPGRCACERHVLDTELVGIGAENGRRNIQEFGDRHRNLFCGRSVGSHIVKCCAILCGYGVHHHDGNDCTGQ